MKGAGIAPQGGRQLHRRPGLVAYLVGYAELRERSQNMCPRELMPQFGNRQRCRQQSVCGAQQPATQDSRGAD
jgi:hypothetical protein